MLFWDLSAAYDKVCPELFIKKAELYGFDRKTRSWFMSFMTQRTQTVKIGSKYSEKIEVNIGVPQGGILSPLIFIIFGADLEEWLIYSKAFTYADDTETNCSGKSDEELKTKLEEDAVRVLQFMASNGLVANPKKTVLMILNSKNKTETKRSIKVGDADIDESECSRLLGMTVDCNQSWKEHVKGKGGLISRLNSKLFCLKRLGNHISKEHQIQVAHSMWMSHLRYGLQLFSTVRTCKEDRD